MSFTVVSLFDERESEHEDEMLPIVMLATMKACGLTGKLALNELPEVYSEALEIDGQEYEATVCGYRKSGSDTLVPLFAIWPMSVERWIGAAPRPPDYSEMRE